MSRKLMLALGVLVFLSALVLGLYLLLGNWMAVAQDSRETVHGMADPPPCDWTLLRRNESCPKRARRQWWFKPPIRSTTRANR